MLLLEHEEKGNQNEEQNDDGENSQNPLCGRHVRSIIELAERCMRGRNRWRNIERDERIAIEQQWIGRNGCCARIKSGQIVVHARDDEGLHRGGGAGGWCGPTGRGTAEQPRRVGCDREPCRWIVHRQGLSGMDIAPACTRLGDTIGRRG